MYCTRKMFLSISPPACILLQHRLATLLNYDRIIVMENGAIVEDGTPHELRVKAGSRFASMLYSSVMKST